MAELIRLRWVSDLGTGLSRRDRTGCWYDAYLPDHLIGRAFRFDGDVAADVAEAEAAVLLLNESATTLRDTEALAHLLLRAESVASSQIEGLQVGGRRLLRAELAAQAGLESDDSPRAGICDEIHLDAVLGAEMVEPRYASLGSSNSSGPTATTLLCTGMREQTRGVWREQCFRAGRVRSSKTSSHLADSWWRGTATAH